MTKPQPYSLDLRECVVAAVEREGMSRPQAASRFGVAVSSAKLLFLPKYSPTSIPLSRSSRS
jgi:transposase